MNNHCKVIQWTKIFINITTDAFITETWWKTIILKSISIPTQPGSYDVNMSASYFRSDSDTNLTTHSHLLPS